MSIYEVYTPKMLKTKNKQKEVELIIQKEFERVGNQLAEHQMKTFHLFMKFLIKAYKKYPEVSK